MITISHFTVLVIGPDYEGQLAPYNEEIQVAPYRSYEDGPWLDTNRKKFAEEHGREPSDEEIAVYMNEQYADDDDFRSRYHLDEKGVYTMSTYNPNSKWDWYAVGGRWKGYFKLREHAMDRPVHAELGQSGVFDNPPRYDADIVTKGDVDADWMRDKAGENAGAAWDRAHAVIDEFPEAEPWESVLARWEKTGEDGYIDKARAEYGLQPRVEAVRLHDNTARKEERHEDVLLGLFSGIEEYQIPRDEYVQRARDAALTPFAYVHNGEWHEPGAMGWWGMSTDTPDSRDAFQREFNKLFDSLPDDTVLTLVDCHI